MDQQLDLVVGWPAPGAHEGVPEAQYHGLQAASASGLKLLRARSPAHLRHQMDFGSAPRETFRVGTLSHLVFLEPDRIPDKLMLCPLGPDGERLDRRSNAAKALWAEVETRAALERRLIVTPADLRVIEGMAAAIREHPTARAYLEGPGPRELSLAWIDPELEVGCKARYDLLREDIATIVDLKFVEDASPAAMGKHIYDWGYNLSAAWYLWGATQTGIDADRFVLICVEKKQPHAVAVYALKDDILELGNRDAREALAQYAECLASGIWPAYGDGELEPIYRGWMWREAKGPDSAGELPSDIFNMEDI